MGYKHDRFKMLKPKTEESEAKLLNWSNTDVALAETDEL